MPRNEILYCKGMDESESDEIESPEDKWDDSQLNAAYDKALKMANTEVAKRIAMATNSKHDGKDQSKSKQKGKAGKNKWSVGMPCRAVYDGDGLQYEAFLVRILTDEDCIVKFLGYDNSEQVAIDSLHPSRGLEAQREQIKRAACEKGDESDSSIPLRADEDLHSDQGHSLKSTVTLSERSFQKKESRKKKRNPMMNGFQFPDMPMPNLSKLRNLAATDFPMPPPPLPFTSSDRDDCEEQAISSMLLSWYMSGYYTGLYQGLKRSKLNKRNKD